MLPGAHPEGEPLPEGLLWLLLTGKVIYLIFIFFNGNQLSLNIDGKLNINPLFGINDKNIHDTF